MPMTTRLSIIGSFVLATLLAAASVELFCRSLEHALVVEEQSSTAEASGPARMESAAPAPGNAVNPRENSIDYTIISKRSLFGKVQQETVEAPPTAAPVLEATSLDLTLIGTISGGVNEQRAIIQDKRKKTQDIYYQGDSVGPALIKEILRGKIILTVRGKDEVLLMKEPKSSGARGNTTLSSPLINQYEIEQPEPIIEEEPEPITEEEPEGITDEVIEPEEQAEELDPDLSPPVAEDEVKGGPGGQSQRPGSMTPPRRVSFKKNNTQVAEP